MKRAYCRAANECAPHDMLIRWLRSRQGSPCFDPYWIYASSVMKCWFLRNIVLALLAVFVTAGLTFAAAQASTMVARMTEISVMGVSDHPDCPDCSGHADKMKQMTCLAACVTPASITAPDASGSDIHPTTSKLPLPRATLLFGSTLSPDPYPPRTTDIG